MSIDQNLFFREAALAVYQESEIHQATYACLTFLGNWQFPVEKMYLQIFDEDADLVRILSAATTQAGQKINHLLPLSPEASQYLMDSLKTTDWIVSVIEQPERNSLAKNILDATDLADRKVAVIRLSVGNKILGSMAFISYKNTVFTEEQIQCLSLLADPISISTALALTTNEALRLQNSLQRERLFKAPTPTLEAPQLTPVMTFPKRIIEISHKVAVVDNNVLITGLSGTGKALLAKGIHELSGRSQKPLILFNCNVLSPALAEQELFGKLGQINSALFSNAPSYIEQANEGTLLLAEIDHLPPSVQGRLLMLLQQQSFQPLHSPNTIRLNLRIIATCHMEPLVLQNNDSLRNDLLQKLEFFPIHLPSLQDRRAELPALTATYLEAAANKLAIPILPILSQKDQEALYNYSWPGNFRQLKNTLESALLLWQGEGTPLNLKSLIPPELNEPVLLSPQSPITFLLEEVTANHIQQVLKITQGKIHGEGGAATLLGINANTLRNKMDKLGIDYKKH